jgi:hypothetical protein
MRTRLSVSSLPAVTLAAVVLVSGCTAEPTPVSGRRNGPG